jgi:hypothetical protein
MTPPRRWILLGVMGIAVAASLAVALRRADITDPAQLEKMPKAKLRDREVETLMRAAFRNAEKINIQWTDHAKDYGPEAYPTISIDGKAVLAELADSFHVGWEGEFTDYRPYYPSSMYLRVTFAGPYKPDFTLTEDHDILIFGGKDDGSWRSVEVSMAFVRKIAAVIGIGYKPVSRTH